MAATDSGANRDKYCGGKKRGPEGGTCTRPAGWGSPHPGIGRCKLHGGNAPSSVIAAERIQVAELAARYSTPRDVHPLQGVMEQYHRLAGQIAWLEARVNATDEGELFWGVESETDKPGGPDGGGGLEVKRKAGPNAYVEQLDKVGAQFAKLGVEIIRIGLETAGDAMASKFAGRLQVMLAELVAELAALAVEQPGVDLAPVFQSRMVAKVAAFAGARPGSVGGVAA